MLRAPLATEDHAIRDTNVFRKPGLLKVALMVGKRAAEPYGWSYYQATCQGRTVTLEQWEKAKQLIEGKNFASFATLMPDGSPQVTPVWVDHKGEVILVNTAEGRVKTKNVIRDPRVALCIFDQSDPYRKVAIRGRVIEVTKEGAEDHIDKMAMKYRGLARYPWRQPGISRVLVKVRPSSISE